MEYAGSIKEKAVYITFKDTNKNVYPCLILAENSGGTGMETSVIRDGGAL